MKRYMTIGMKHDRIPKFCQAFRVFVFLPLYLFIFLPLFSGCSMVDEDLSECEEKLNVQYQVSLKTNLALELQTVLRNRFETEVADLLEDSLKMIFREYAHDVDLSFFANGDLSFFDHHIMDAGQATYELNLPAEDYHHLALANMMEEPSIFVNGTDRENSLQLIQSGSKQIDSHRIGLFTARHDIDIKGNQSQTFNVTFYMANCASVLVIRNEKNVQYKDIWVRSSDFANGFMVNDSVFKHDENPMVNDVHVMNPPKQREVFYAVTFPSCDTAEDAHRLTSETRAEIGDEDVQLGDEDQKRIWRKYVFVRLLNGTVTRTVLNVRKALMAGQVMVIYVDLEEGGGIKSANPEIGTSITLDWKSGLIIEN